MGKFVPNSQLRNQDWAVWQTDNGKYTDEAVKRAILIDIRDALLRLCHVFECANAQRIPATLDQIMKNTRRVHRATWRKR